MELEIERRLAAEFSKQCRVCGVVHTRGHWAGLVLKGTKSDSYCTLELRDCSCGSTLAAIVSIHDLSEE